MNRKDELALLERLYRSGKKEVLVLYGLGRVGRRNPSGWTVGRKHGRELIRK
ncbi:hypothetical protein [Thermococcus siculi]|uniref:hypothetical protein n=1 Tax=Thermococcus siculi TaxID=72803 RepID=UPI0018DFC764|nr:hypothetical protein [Thermococcus siculi]